MLGGCGAGQSETTSTPSAPTASSTAPTSPSASPTSPSSPRPSATPTSTADGTYASELSLSEDGALSYVPLRWYAGRNAEARCQEKDIEPEGAWCTDYYYEEAGGRKAAAVTEDTRVRLLNDDLEPANASLSDLVQAIEDENWPNYQIVVSGGRVTRITQVFTP